MILCTDLEYGIGYKGKLPFESKEDLAYFSKMTKGATVVMGRKTYESLPFDNGLPNRENLVLSSQDLSEKERIITKMMNARGSLDEEDVWIIGGKSLYEDYAPLCDEIHLSTFWEICITDVKVDIFSMLKGFYGENYTWLSDKVSVSVYKPLNKKAS